MLKWPKYLNNLKYKIKEQYISKSALVAKIERRIKTNKECMLGLRNLDYYQGKVDALNDTISFLNNLEVKEIDLEDSIKDTLAQKYIDYTCKRHNIDPASREGQLIYYAYMHGMNQCLNQLKAQK